MLIYGRAEIDKIENDSRLNHNGRDDIGDGKAYPETLARK